MSEAGVQTGADLADLPGPIEVTAELCSAPVVAGDTAFYSLVKRLFDIGAAFCGLLLCAPLWAVIAATIKLDSPGPIWFRHRRTGKDGRPFYLLKFRSMCENAHDMLPQVMHLNPKDDDPLLRIRNDPRITRVGRWLRATSLDETPQLINILRGEMSLVGPRPIGVPMGDDPRTKLRLAALPGLTGLWQISGRKETGCDYMLEKDMEYLSRRSFSCDLKILLKTIPAVLGRNGAR